ncbi:MAG: hypothetical protein QOE23_1924, partial [Pseudonocardiales bacterium]|nr:hypothetical protein [Pseudonocardiales bacterium]
GGLLDVLLGAVLLSVGAAVALNWRGWAGRYTDFIDDVMPATRRSMTVDRWPRLLIQNRIIFGVIAAFGVALLIGGIAGLAG